MNRKPLTTLLLFILLLSIVEILPDGVHRANAAGDFTVTATSPSIPDISIVGEGTDGIKVTGSSGFTGTVTLTASVTPSTGLTASLSPPSVVITSPNPVVSTLTVDASALGSYTINVTGASGTLQHSTTVTVNVVPGGLVCVGSTSAPPTSPCAAPPGVVVRSLPPATPPRQIKFAVYVNNSNSLNTYDITLLADHTVLLPISASFTGGILINPNLLINCIGGVNKLGPGSCPSTDTADTIHFSATSSSFTSPPTTGLLFTATYNITGSTPPAGIPVTFQTGCTGTGIRNTCVKIGAGTAGIVPETVQGGFFVNLPDFAISIPPTTTFTATVGGSTTLTVTSLSTFAGPVSLSAVSNSTNLTASFNPNSVTLTSGGFKTSTLNMASSIDGNYTVTVTATGTSGSFQLLHKANITVFVIPKNDFNITAIPTTVTFDNGTITTSIVSVRSTTGFTGVVKLTASPTPGLTVNFNTTTLTLTAIGSTNSSLLTFSSSTPGDYSLIITGQNASGPRPTHRAFITIHVADFTISANPSSLTVYKGTPGTSTITLVSRFNFATVLSLTAVANASGLTPTIRGNILLRAGQSNSTLLTVTGTIVGNYTVTVAATDGSITHKTVVAVNLKPPDFGISASPTTILEVLNSNNSTFITVTRLGSFNGTITLSTSSLPTGVTTSPAPPSISLGIALLMGTSNLTINVAANAVPGVYVLNVVGTNTTGLSHQVQVTINILKPDFVIVWNSRATNTKVVNNTKIDVSFSFGTQIQLFSKNHFTGTVNLTATVSPLGPATFNVTSLPISAGGSGGATLDIPIAPSVSPGNYTIILTAKTVSLTHSMALILVVGDFQIASPPLATASVGFNSTTILTLNGINHFIGNITLSTTSNSSGVNSFASPQLIILQDQGPVNSTLLIAVANNTAAGTYRVTVTGVIGGQTHSVTITLTVVLHDVAITAVSFTSDGQMIGATVTFTITVKNQGTVPENVTIEALAGPYAVAVNNLLGLQPGASQTITLIWKTNDYAAGSYQLGAKAIAVSDEATTANNIMYSGQSLTLNAPPQPFWTQALITEIAEIAAAVAVVGLAALFLLRRRKTAKTL